MCDAVLLPFLAGLPHNDDDDHVEDADNDHDVSFGIRPKVVRVMDLSSPPKHITSWTSGIQSDLLREPRSS